MPRISHDPSGSPQEPETALYADLPVPLRGFAFHGLVLSLGSGIEAVTDCPFCDRDGKLYINSTTGQWSCKTCGGGGNLVTFMRQLWDASDKATTEYEGLSKDRGLLYPETLGYWGVAKSILTNEWLVPGHGPDGKVCQVYKYAYNSVEKRMFLYPTPGLDPNKPRHGIHGMLLWDSSKPDVYLCEGIWDGLVLWEVLRSTRTSEEGLIFTADESNSLLATTNVLAVPTCSIFPESWTPLLEGKNVYLLYDNDHPKKHSKTGAYIPPSAYEGMKRVARTLLSAEKKPREVLYLRWGASAKDDHHPGLKHGYDVRDALTSTLDARERILLFEELIGRLKPLPEAWTTGLRVKQPKGKEDSDLPPLPCDNWDVLVSAWRKALKWTPGLDRALSVMLASIISTETLGDQLWVKIMGPPSCGKSTLCEALSVARKYIVAKSTIRGFHSGYKSDKTGHEDHSLIPKIRGKTLITKDGDTLLQSPNLAQIISEARDLYDCVSRAHYRHGLSRDYIGVRMTWILCGTGSLRLLDQSELGARFLDCKIMETIDEELEKEVNWKVVNRAFRNVSIMANGASETLQEPSMTLAKQLTGGYVEYLRDNADRLLSQVIVTEAAARHIISMGEFVSFMRARPSKKQSEVVEREFSSRLVEQHARLAACLAAVLQRPSIDEEVMSRVCGVAIDTSHGQTLEICKHLYRCGPEGASRNALGVYTGYTIDALQKLLAFLKDIEAVEYFYGVTKKKGVVVHAKWRLTDRLRRLYGEVVPRAKDSREQETDTPSEGEPTS